MRNKGFLNAVARRSVCSKVIVGILIKRRVVASAEQGDQGLLNAYSKAVDVLVRRNIRRSNIAETVMCGVLDSSSRSLSSLLA